MVAPSLNVRFSDDNITEMKYIIKKRLKYKTSSRLVLPVEPV